MDIQQLLDAMEGENHVIIPIFPLELAVLPGEPQILRIFEPRYKQMLDDCLLDDHPFGICLIDPFHPVSGWAGPHLTGCTARITGHEEVGSNHMVEIQGQRRFRVLELIEPALPPMDPVQHRVFPDLESLLGMTDEDGGKLYIRAQVEFVSEPEGILGEDTKKELEELWITFLGNLASQNQMPGEMVDEWLDAQLATVLDWDAAALWRIASVLVVDPHIKQSMLECHSLPLLAADILMNSTS